MRYKLYFNYINNLINYLCNFNFPRNQKNTFSLLINIQDVTWGGLPNISLS